MSNELELKPDAALPAIINFEEDAGTGFENLTTKDVSIPFISIVQQLSAALKRETKIAGAEEGHILNTVTQEVVPGEKGIVVIPCAYQKKWVEWKPRSSGGGFVKHHDTEAILAQCTQDDKMNEILPTGNQIVETAYFYVLLKTAEGNWTKAVLPMSKTQLKKAKKWNTIMSNIKFPRAKGGAYTPPPFSHSYSLKTIREAKSGFSWFGWEIAMEGIVKDFLIYEVAKELHKEVEKGGIKVEPVGEPTEEQTTLFPEGM
jgi:hypothetical protein